MKTSALRIILTAILLVTADVSIGIAKKTVVQRPVEDAFVDTFFLTDVDPIRAQMPGNMSDPDSNLLAGIRVDNLDYVAGMGTFTDIDEMLLAFYENQQAFNEDPDRNRIRMHGSVQEIIEDDGTVVAKIDIAYRDLPLTVYTSDSFFAIFDDLDLAGLVKVVENGTMVGRFSVEMEIPFPGAPLHYWDAVLSGKVRRQSFVGHGSGWHMGESGEWERVQVHVIQTERDGEFTSEIVRIVPGF